MGGESGFLFLWILFTTAPALVLLVVLGFRSLKPNDNPHAVKGLGFSLISALVFCLVGVIWWIRNFPQDLNLINVFFFLVFPGFTIGACVYGIIVKGFRAAKRIL